jgi:hypothetical protein
MVTSQAIIDRINAMTSTVITDEVDITQNMHVPEVAASEAQAADQLILEQSAEPEAIPNVVDDEPREVEPSIEDREERADAEQPVEQPIIEPEQVVTAWRSARIAQGITLPE